MQGAARQRKNKELEAERFRLESQLQNRQLPRKIAGKVQAQIQQIGNVTKDSKDI
jgi:hypothetical protein